MKTHSEGEWRATDDAILFRDAAANVVPYSFELKGDTLTFISMGTLKSRTVLKKQP